MNGDNESVEGPVRDITVPSQDGKTEIFSIRFLKPGRAVIKVSAIADLASDAIERMLTIKVFAFLLFFYLISHIDNVTCNALGFKQIVSCRVFESAS